MKLPSIVEAQMPSMVKPGDVYVLGIDGSKDIAPSGQIPYWDFAVVRIITPSVTGQKVQVLLTGVLSSSTGQALEKMIVRPLLTGKPTRRGVVGFLPLPMQKFRYRLLKGSMMPLRQAPSAVVDLYQKFYP